MAKKIAVGKGLEFRFDQRNKGEETRYWVGTIFKDGGQIGSFNNNGRGGMTNVQPHTLEVELSKMATDEAERQGYKGTLLEPFDLVIEFAELLGYRKGLAGHPPEKVWPVFMKQVIEQQKD
jgi:hypothetical protein